METDQETRYVIGDREARQISTYCTIASTHNSALRLSELIQLMAIDATEEDMERAWRENEVLSTKYRLSSGYVVETDQTTSDRVTEEEENRKRAERNLAVAKKFAHLCVDENVKLLAVSGGNSYQSARDGDDIDFFCVIKKDSLWVFMLRSLILARVYRMARRSPQLCFSYMMDEGRARKEFGEARDGLFARDALAARVLSGQQFYRSLLEAADWMKGYYPRLYHQRMNDGWGQKEEEEEEEDEEEEDEDEDGSADSARGSRVLDSFLYYTVGSYIRTKAYLANGRYRKTRKIFSVFHVRVDRDHCIYESNRYKWLRRMYSGPASISRERVSE